MAGSHSQPTGQWAAEEGRKTKKRNRNRGQTGKSVTGNAMPETALRCQSKSLQESKATEPPNRPGKALGWLRFAQPQTPLERRPKAASIFGKLSCGKRASPKALVHVGECLRSSPALSFGAFNCSCPTRDDQPGHAVTRAARSCTAHLPN